VTDSPTYTETLMSHPGEYWTQKAYGTSENRGKELRRDGFGLAEERYSRFRQARIDDNND